MGCLFYHLTVAFAEDKMSDAPDSDKCSTFADYVVETYISDHTRYPPYLWASSSNMDTKRTNNGPETFHSHFNEQFYSAHPPIYVFIDVLLKQQTKLYQN